jgi:3'-phosphoadenosine 5'-phosphosulfate sulfotransferase (PAPS reductase)/FAD synthetase
MKTGMTKYDLIEKQGWSLEQKVDHTLGAIEQFYNRYSGNVYISFSGGKDSTVLLHIARLLFPNIKCVFADTGLEYPEIRDFCKQTENCTFVKPRRNFKWVIDNYGYPVISKKISMGVSRYRNTKCELQKELRLHGGINPTSGMKQHPTVSRKWHYLIDAPFKISERCCDVLKKEPLITFEKETGLHPIIGTMAEESSLRVQQYLKHGCNAFDRDHPQSTPMMFWTEADVWLYIEKFSVPYCGIYDLGYKRTGCMFCMFGIANESKPNRFEQMKATHPAQYNYCINKLGLGGVLDFIGIKY